MKEDEYRIKAAILKKEIERNRRIHCVRVAARLERQLEKLKEEYKKGV